MYKGEGKFFKSVETKQALLAYENGVITLHQNIMYTVRRLCQTEQNDRYCRVYTWSLIFNEIFRRILGFVDSSTPERMLLKLEIDFHVGKKQLKQILEKVINTHGATKTAEVLDDIKAMGYKYSTRAAMTVSISDMTVPPQKPQMIQHAQAYSR